MSKKTDEIDVIRHSTAHIMAEAVLELYSDVKFGIGPAIENGFYYDFDLPHTFTPEDLSEIENKMLEIIKRNGTFEKSIFKKEEAIDFFGKQSQIYKVELLEEITDEKVSVYKHGKFIDLCRGPHVSSVSAIKAFKLMSLAGAYWRGNEKRPMLQRIYGVAFETSNELEKYLKQVEEAKKRDHRVLGKELDLFSFHEEAPGFPFFHPNGMVVLNEILSYWRKHHISANYKEVRTPILLTQDLWKQSGHWENYRENMYFTEIDKLKVAVKPMNCPGGVLIYKSQTHSYRDLPLRLMELGLVHRHELSGVMHGLFRVRSFVQDDAHIFCLPEQIENEVIGVMELTMNIYKGFGFKEWELELSTKPEKAIGTEEMWDAAETSLKAALEHQSLNYKLNEGEGAFYGPKIDFHITDSMGRKWQCATIQLDFAMPERFDLEYMGADNLRHRPVMIHRAVLGSIERFFGILIEHYGGVLPPWLSPVQVVVIPIADRHNDYANKMVNIFKEKEIRIEFDNSKEQIGRKIRNAQLRKIPYMLVVGDKESESATVAIRERTKGDLGSRKVDEAADMIFSDCQSPAV